MLRKLEKGVLSKLLYFIDKDTKRHEEIRAILKSHPEVQYVSLVGVDLGGQDTDEKIPVAAFLEDLEEFLKTGIQTDGSSVFLPHIATLNNAKVMILPDISVKWIVDYNFDHLDNDTGLPVGTIRIPSILVHDEKEVCSRAILKRGISNFKKSMMETLKTTPEMLKEIGVEKIEDIKEVLLTSATELEFWVQTPEDSADEEQLSTSQTLKEQYWKRTQGVVRTALEKSIWLMEKYGFEPEMGHKEVGGVRQKIGIKSRSGHIMEQLEIDWKFSNAIQAADNELFIRNLVSDVFNYYGLEVTFLAKPIEGVAGNGEHTHLGIAVKLNDGSIKNLFSTLNAEEEYMTNIGFASLMGILKNYEVINPFVTSTNDALNRLTPGFEAPICIVSSLGKSAQIPSRNRSILIGLIRDMENSKSTRFELRAPNPYSNTYLVIASCYQAMLDGIEYAAKNNKTGVELEKEFSKSSGESFGYLDADRQYRSEEDVFEYYTDEERDGLFGIPPKTVWENVKGFKLNSEKVGVLTRNGVFSDILIKSYATTIIEQWIAELEGRIIPNNMEIVRACKKMHSTEDISDLDVVMWNRINEVRWYLMKDTVDKHSLFTRIKNAIEEKDYEKVSELQVEMKDAIRKLKDDYLTYTKNIL